MTDSRAELLLRDGAVREEAVVLETSRGRLFGVVCTPAAAAAREDWLVFLSAATVRRVGNNRLSTTYAREWARAGLASLRFDTYGVGDSEGLGREEEPAVGDQGTLYEPGRIAAVTEVLDRLAGQRGARRFCLIGLSSGGTNGLHAALVDERVAGVVLLNSSTLFWDEHAVSLAAWKEAKRLARSPGSWRAGLLRRGVRSWVGDAARGAIASLRGFSDDWHRRRILDAVDTCRARQAAVTLVYSSGDPGLAYLERHLGPDFRAVLEQGGANVRVVKGPDHTFRPLWSHDVLRELVEGHLGSIGFLGSEARQPQQDRIV